MNNSIKLLSMKFTSVLCLLFFGTFLFGQVQTDLTESVPAWITKNNNEVTFHWIPDAAAANYTINEVLDESLNLQLIETVDGSINSYVLGEITPGEIHRYQLQKSSTNNSASGRGLLTVGIEVPAVQERGRCLIVIDDTLNMPLVVEIETLMEDMEMDGWLVDTVSFNRTQGVGEVKNYIVNWYEETFDNAQAVFLLGHVAVPYSGNSAHDGHGNHQGAWAADVYYADIDGIWTDVSVNNTSPSRAANKNIPGDGKFDQTSIPSDVEIQIGRVDFSNMPAFELDEIELTRNYLNKNHAFKIGQKETIRRALVENNFASFAEGFGQSGWRNFVPMFGADSVVGGNYEVALENESYLCSYACGPGSYTSAGGIGTTANLWAAKEIKTIFTMTFGSYFGDWDVANNFLRGALASGDVLTNAWAGRPVWYFYPMALGQNTGHCTQLSQNALSNSFYETGFSRHSAHIALMGDPTLRLHAMKQAADLSATFETGDIELTWTASPDATNGYFVYRKVAGGNWQLLASFTEETSFTDPCPTVDAEYAYMVKAIRLEETGSGSYFNTSLGITTAITVAENPFVATYYADVDMDGFGDMAVPILACEEMAGFVDNDLDCDDTNAAINPDAEDIPNNNIDEDCDGQDMITDVNDLVKKTISIYPNPVKDQLYIATENSSAWTFQLYNSTGQLIQAGELKAVLDLAEFSGNILWLRLQHKTLNTSIVEKVVVQ